MSIDTFRFIAERNLAHKMLEFFLKDCWDPHKGRLGAACSCRDRNWEPSL